MKGEFLMLINKNDVVLFQGDSITDWGRTSLKRAKDDLGEIQSAEEEGNYGIGYVSSAVQQFHALFPDMGVRFINRGISGNRTKELAERWEKDCLQLRPDVVSILIGINDTWRRFDSDDPTDAKQFEANYRRILDLTKENLPNAKIILMEPFLLPMKEEEKLWRADLDEKIQVVRSLSREYRTELIPLDGIFHQACTKCSYDFFSIDGVHTTYNGSALIAEHWMRCVGARK